jgi:hypothetical protein
MRGINLEALIEGYYDALSDVELAKMVKALKRLAQKLVDALLDSAFPGRG